MVREGVDNGECSKVAQGGKAECEGGGANTVGEADSAYGGEGRYVEEEDEDGQEEENEA